MNSENISYFLSDEERNNLLVSWKLATEKNVKSKVFYYKLSDNEASVCEVVGYCPHESVKVLAVQVNGTIHKVLAAYFKEMQSGNSRIKSVSE